MITVDITIAGQTVTTEIYLGLVGGRAASTEDVFLGRVGNGAKTHRMDLLLWDTTQSHRQGRDIVTDSDGDTWYVSKFGKALGRDARVVGIIEDASQPTSQHAGWETTRK